jgi:hypothetical protein
MAAADVVVADLAAEIETSIKGVGDSDHHGSRTITQFMQIRKSWMVELMLALDNIYTGTSDTSPRR